MHNKGLILKTVYSYATGKVIHVGLLKLNYLLVSSSSISGTFRLPEVFWSMIRRIIMRGESGDIRYCYHFGTMPLICNASRPLHQYQISKKKYVDWLGYMYVGGILGTERAERNKERKSLKRIQDFVYIIFGVGNHLTSSKARTFVES